MGTSLLKKKSILIVLFSNAPSSVVRAKYFSQGFSRSAYKAHFQHFNIAGLDQMIETCTAGNRTNFPIWLCAAILRILRRCISLLLLIPLLVRARKADGIMLIKYPPIWLSKVLRKFSHAPLLYDFDDTLWASSFYGEKKFRKLISGFDFVSADNEYLEAKARMVCQNTFVLNGPSQVELFDRAQPIVEKRTIPVLGWIGSRATLEYLQMLARPIWRLYDSGLHFRLRIVGTGGDHPILNGFPPDVLETRSFYDQEGMVKEVLGFDIGIFPLFNDEVAIGRGLHKARIYMSGRVPVVASDVGFVSSLIRNGENGLLANTEDEWVDSITTLLSDKKLRSRIGTSGYQDVKDKYSIEACFKELECGFLAKL